ncbi:MAG: hypothetical protein NVSMB17_09020 [Candidatus Dormibacteria bacterium]
MEGLVDQPHLALPEVAQAPVDQLAGTAAGTGGEVSSLHQAYLIAPPGGLERDPRPGDPTADDKEVETPVGEVLEVLPATQRGEGPTAVQQWHGLMLAGKVKRPPTASGALQLRG